jgi:hypothetical protein
LDLALDGGGRVRYCGVRARGAGNRGCGASGTSGTSGTSGARYALYADLNKLVTVLNNLDALFGSYYLYGLVRHG